MLLFFLLLVCNDPGCVHAEPSCVGRGCKVGYDVIACCLVGREDRAARGIFDCPQFAVALRVRVYGTYIFDFLQQQCGKRWV